MLRHIAIASVLIGVMSSAACGSEEESTPSTAVTTSGPGGGGGAGGAGGSGGSGGAVCPVDLPTDTCSDIDRTCSYGGACCICSNIGCGIVWECVNPTDNDAACPDAPPPGGTMCDPNSPACSYCVGEVPRLMVCQQGEWTEGAITGCQ